MQTKITQSVVQNITPEKKTLKVYDTLLKGFVLFVRPTGKKTWYVDYRKPDGQRTNYFIGHSTLLTVVEAREEARKFLAAINRGEDPTAPPPQPETAPTLGDFMEDKYAPWVIFNRKSGQETVVMITRAFKSLLNVPLDQITVAKLENWRTQEKQERGKKASSLNREITALKASINWAVHMDIIKENPMSKLKSLPENDSATIVRYLSVEERTRLMAALKEREEEMRQERQSHNEWRKERHFEELPNYQYFTDHLKPMILLALSTGVRQGTLFGLEWRDVDFSKRLLTLRLEIEKSKKTRFMSLNDTAYDVLFKWKEQSGKTAPNAFIFPSPNTGKKLDNCRSSWEALLKKAQLEDFRWHDMRHDFASQLVMSGVDLNTVRDLMGHADIKMTLRYAHLAPENRLQAVKVLDRIMPGSVA
jgi:site-specific recombinase XerD